MLEHLPGRVNSSRKLLPGQICLAPDGLWIEHTVRVYMEMCFVADLLEFVAYAFKGRNADLMTACVGSNRFLIRAVDIPE